MSKKIVYLSPYFWPEEIGSAPYCTDLAAWLQSKGHNVSVQSFRPHYPSVDQFQAWKDGARDHEGHDGVSITRVAVAGRGDGGFKDRLRNDLAFLYVTLKRCFKGDFAGTDVVIAYVPSILTTYGARIIRLFTRADIICVVHDIESGLAASLGMVKSPAVLFFMRLVEKIGFNFAQQVVVLTEGMKDELISLGCRRPVQVLPIWASVAPAVPAPSGDAVLTYSGNFGKKQNLDQLLPLIKCLATDAPEVKIIMRGDGSERGRIQGVVQDLKLSNTVFLPLSPAEEFMNTLQAVNIHLVPQALNTANYALPSKVFSIMSAGRPFICVAEADSPLDRLTKLSGAGLCVPPDQETALLTATLDLIKDPQRQSAMGEMGRAYIKNHMSREMILTAYENLVVETQARKPKPLPNHPGAGRAALVNSTETGLLDTGSRSSLDGAPSFSLQNRMFRFVWIFVWGVLASWTPAPLHGWRCFLLRLFGAKIGSGVRVYGSANIWYPPNLEMGDFSCIGWDSVIYCQAKITLQSHANVSQYAHLVAGSHEIDSPSFQLYARPIVIGAYAWISSGAFVGPGVDVGEGAVLGARGVAFTALKPWTVYAGNPAKEIRQRRNWLKEAKSVEATE